MGLTIKNLYKAYEEKAGEMQYVIKNLNLKIETGEFICILGKSGCGKSTLLNLLAGYLKADEGVIKIGIKEIDGPSANRGVVFQQHALFPWRTVLGNVRFGFDMRKVGRKEANELALEYIDLVGLNDYINHYPASLSGGMAQRVGIARALANDPEILLMDEPLGALDALTRDSMRREIERIWKVTGKTIVLITHSVPEAVYLADRVIVLQNGEAVADRKIEMERPRDLSEAQFLEYVKYFESVITGTTGGNVIAE